MTNGVDTEAQKELFGPDVPNYALLNEALKRHPSLRKGPGPKTKSSKRTSHPDAPKISKSTLP
jgi:hypothetical protein